MVSHPSLCPATWLSFNTLGVLFLLSGLPSFPLCSSLSLAYVILHSQLGYHLLQEAFPDYLQPHRLGEVALLGTLPGLIHISLHFHKKEQLSVSVSLFHTRL